MFFYISIRGWLSFKIFCKCCCYSFLMRGRDTGRSRFPFSPGLTPGTPGPWPGQITITRLQLRSRSVPLRARAQSSQSALRPLCWLSSERSAKSGGQACAAWTQCGTLLGSCEAWPRLSRTDAWSIEGWGISCENFFRTHPLHVQLSPTQGLGHSDKADILIVHPS